MSKVVGTVLQDSDAQFVGLSVERISPLPWKTRACREKKCCQRLNGLPVL